MGTEQVSPVKFSVRTVNNQKLSWHRNLELIYVLRGSLSITLKNTTSTLFEDGLIVINPYDMHALRGNNTVILSLEIILDALSRTVLVNLPQRFDCNSAYIENDRELDKIKMYIARIISHSFERDELSPLDNQIYAYKILRELAMRYGVSESRNLKAGEYGFQKMGRILEYINQHYQEKLTLERVAQVSYLTPPYLSKMLKKYIGINFTDYLMNIRLDYAVMDLQETEDSIEEISGRHGFASSRSFSTAFKNSYGMLPSSYRKQYRSMNPRLKKNSENIDLQSEQYQLLSKLSLYLENGNSPVRGKNRYDIRKVEFPAVKVSQKGIELRHTFKHMMSVESAGLLLNNRVQQVIVQLKQSIGFEYIIFHGLLDSDLAIYSVDECDRPCYSFYFVDQVTDFLISAGLKPWIEFSYMPEDMALCPDNIRYLSKAVISLPKSMEQWKDLVEQLIRHWIGRYGLLQVRQWIFSLWNLPDSPEQLFGITPGDFFEFYKSTWRTIKEMDTHFQVASPSLLPLTVSEDKQGWFTAFTAYCQKNGCLPDLWQFHYYPMRKGQLDEVFLMKSNLAYTDSENDMKAWIYDVKRRFRQLGISSRKQYLTEWNMTISHRELLGDTMYMAVYLVKNILENYDRFESFTYWNATDITKEVPIVNKTFYGGLGLVTQNGIKKPTCYVLQMLAKLGNLMIGKGNGYFVTKGHGNIQILLYNYQHYSRLYASGELLDITDTKRYTPFSEAWIRRVVLILEDMENGDWNIKETVLNQMHGSAFDQWLDYGAVEPDCEDDVAYLKNKSLPHVIKSRQIIENGRLRIQRDLHPHEIRLIELWPQKWREKWMEQ